mmetsp:Transcript_35932/g.118311  ORF Transcript_35932/g.118311 Transcript_35932/m.118311 type:complete len:203 (+) Transcript_35932:1455-2063(+)
MRHRRFDGGHARGRAGRDVGLGRVRVRLLQGDLRGVPGAGEGRGTENSRYFKTYPGGLLRRHVRVPPLHPARRGGAAARVRPQQPRGARRRPRRFGARLSYGAGDSKSITRCNVRDNDEEWRRSARRRRRSGGIARRPRRPPKKRPDGTLTKPGLERSWRRPVRRSGSSCRACLARRSTSRRSRRTAARSSSRCGRQASCRS